MLTGSMPCWYIPYGPRTHRGKTICVGYGPRLKAFISRSPLILYIRHLNKVNSMLVIILSIPCIAAESCLSAGPTSLSVAESFLAEDPSE